MCLAAFCLCFVFPLICLDAPLNSIMANLGLGWAMLWMLCPPKFAHCRAVRMAMLILWPMLTVAVPLMLRFCSMHKLKLQPFANNVGIVDDTSIFLRPTMGSSGPLVVPLASESPSIVETSQSMMEGEGQRLWKVFGWAGNRKAQRQSLSDQLTKGRFLWKNEV